MPKRFVVLALPMLVIALAMACGDGNDGNDGQPASTPTATAGELPATPTMPAVLTPAATPTNAGPDADIHAVDLATRPEVENFVGSYGGEADVDRIRYGDLTGDGRDEAVLPIDSGGSLGDLAIFAFGYVDGQLKQLVLALPAQPRSGVSARIQNGRLITTEAYFADDDPLCCPSQIRRVTYRWNGSILVIDGETIDPAP
ncbi:MAG: hypothetical protein WBD55_03950 [Dehalococcoidia bacterium]